MNQITETLRGIVERVTYHDQARGWSILRVSPFANPEQQETVTVHQTRVFAGASSCSGNGRVFLNLELIKASKESIDYVIMHELCHLKVSSHGPKFWRILTKLMPDYEERRRKLNRFADV